MPAVFTTRSGLKIRTPFLINHLQSAESTYREEIVDQLDVDASKLSPSAFAEALRLKKGVDPDLKLEEELEAFKRGVKTRDDMYIVHSYYSATEWMFTNTRTYVIAMCSVLVALSKKFGLEPSPVWRALSVTPSQSTSAA